jgi:hypothetical protein
MEYKKTDLFRAFSLNKAEKKLKTFTAAKSDFSKELSIAKKSRKEGQARDPEPSSEHDRNRSLSEQSQAQSKQKINDYQQKVSIQSSASATSTNGLTSTVLPGIKNIFNLPFLLNYKLTNQQKMLQEMSYRTKEFLYQTIEPQVEAIMAEAVKIIMSKKNGKHRLSIELEPEGLGEIKLTLLIENDSLKLTVEAGPDVQNYFKDNEQKVKKVFAKYKQLTIGY